MITAFFRLLIIIFEKIIKSWKVKSVSLEFQEYLYLTLKNKINSIEEKDIKDIYALSFYINDEDDDPRFPNLILGFNTIKNMKIEIKNASSKSEAKWNYAYWLQNELAAICSEDDIKGRNLWINLLKIKRLHVSNYEIEVDYSEIIENKLDLIKKHFVNLAIECSKRIHEEGIIRNKFNSDIPIIVHELEYYDEIADQTKLANPPKIADEFVKYVNDNT
ncbi:hypothetical protein [Leptospira sp. GIMC2001]|uniref:hypothetical protein n=1 Tax=Leptospira sp. GIMC2001 TaxID=1513297 RepID=UPI00234B8267|nr:hypothetical protein [Leptospira sp. GIMC2001]WCL51051.1 hypothetical protein O4O04_09625 [Leptospira sp. GIMC2001]